MKEYNKIIKLSLIAFLVFLLWQTGVGMAFSFDSSTPPAGYKPQKGIKTQFQIVSEGGTPDILLIQTAIPWASNADTQVLDALGYSYNEIDITEVPNTNIDDYQVVLIVNDQVQSFYDNYALNYDKFENYVMNGGTLVFFACDHGWAAGDNYTDLPGHIEVGDRYSPYNIISNPNNPIVTQELVDHVLLFGYQNVPINDADLYGNYCSHNYFVENTLPSGSDIVFRTNDSDKFPTFVVYKLGNGYVIGSGNTWEAAFAWWNRSIPSIYSFGRALPDVFKYAFSIAGGHKAQGVSIKNIYPEDNSVEYDRPVTYKHPADLVNIASFVTNATLQEITNVSLKLEVPADAFNTEFTPRVFKRASAEEIAIKDPVEIPNVQKEIIGDQLVVTISNLAIRPGNQDFVFTLQLASNLQSRLVNATATVFGDNITTASKSLSSYNSQIAITRGKIFLTNRRAMYQMFAKDGNNISPGGASQVNQLWKTLNTIAEEQEGVIYYVDQYDQFLFDENNNPTHTWNDDRAKLDYSKGENQINATANLVDSMLKSFIDHSGGVCPSVYVAIVGDDSIIPFYRVWDPSKTVLKYSSAHNITNSKDDISLKAAQNNYFYTDRKYRDYVENCGNGEVETIFVGRIIGKSASDMAIFINSSNKTTSNSEDVIKLENWRRDGELNDYEKYALSKGFNVIKKIENTELDYYPGDACPCPLWDPFCIVSCHSQPDDPAKWSDFEKLFTGNADNVTDFAVFRGMTHGNIQGIASSGTSEDEKGPHNTHTYYDATNITKISNTIKTKFNNFNPFFIHDACLVGLTDGNANTFMNAWAPLATRGFLSSTAITYSYSTGNVSDFNDLFSLEILSGFSAGRSLSKADIDSAKNCDGCTYTKLEMNLYGVPWASISTPKKQNINNIMKAGVSTEYIRATDIKGALEKSISVDTSNYSIETTSDNYNLVLIDGFKLLLDNGVTPVVPFQKYTVDIPLNASVNNVTVTFKDQQSLGQLNIPAFIPPPPVIDPNATLVGYVPSPSNIGLFPVEQFTYEVNPHDNLVRVIVTVYPVIFDSATHETEISKSIDIVINYTTPSTGFVTGFSTNKEAYAVNENIATSTTIENTSADTMTYQINTEIRDYLNNLIASSSASVSINSNSSETGISNIAAPGMPGNYKVLVTVSDEGNQIGSSEQMIKVINAQIEYMNCPLSIRKGEYGTFQAGIKNLTDVAVNAYVDFIVYDGQRMAAKLPQIIAANILSDETRDVQTQWYPTTDLNAGNYTLQAVITINDSTLSSDSKTFYITNNTPVSLITGWNLISLPAQPADLDIRTILNPVSSIYRVVWAYQNGIWKLFDPMNSAYNDLGSMEASVGYWIKIDQDAVLDINGGAPPSSINLSAGWNLVGYNTTTKSVTDVLSSIEGKYISVWTYYNGGWKVFAPANPDASDLTTMEPGYGYWINATENCTWSLNEAQAASMSTLKTKGTLINKIKKWFTDHSRGKKTVLEPPPMPPGFNASK